MNKKELIEKIKTQLKSLVSSKFAEQKAGDRLIVTPDENFMINSEVYLRDGEGNNVPLLDGEYTFDDGVKIVVSAGKIKSMVEPEGELAEEEETEDVEVEAAEEPKEEEKDEMGEEEEPKEDAMEKLMAKIKMIEEKVEEMAKKFEEVDKENEKMKQEFSKIAEQPSTSTIEASVAEFKSLEEKSNSIGAVDIMAIREKARKNR
jgi:outer membrane biosynthesis protein TonB